MVAEYLKPHLDSSLWYSNVFLDRADLSIELSRFAVCMNDQVKVKPNRSSHGLVMAGRSADNEASPNETPPPGPLPGKAF